MPEKNIDLHGSVPDKHSFALLLIDVINDFNLPEADQLLQIGDTSKSLHFQFRLANVIKAAHTTDGSTLGRRNSD